MTVPCGVHEDASAATIQDDPVGGMSGHSDDGQLNLPMGGHA